MSIENAAREIARVELEEMNEGLGYECIAEIIRHHLFPVVKPEDVDDGFYWVKLPGYPWAIRQPWIHKDDRGETIMFKAIVSSVQHTYAASECEIRGPVPMPE